MRFRVLALALMFAACGDDGNTPVDAPDEGDAAIDASNADTLMETGLCVDTACTMINPGIFEFAPQYQLYADGSTKRRWIQIPAGTTIDTTDMNFWKFPVGTKLWKEFTRDTTRVETRYIEKIGADDTLAASWTYRSYVWNTTQDATMLVSPQTGMTDANGTMHDVPRRTDCRRCHEGVPGRILGVNAMSLDYTSPTLDLGELVAMNLLSTPPAAPTVDAYFPVPGTAEAKAAFGYLHANCGGCHNPTSSVHDVTPLELRMDVTLIGTVATMPAHATTVNVNGTLGVLTGPIVSPMDPSASVMIIRMNASTTPEKMPEIGTETVDPDGQAILAAWINQLL